MLDGKSIGSGLSSKGEEIGMVLGAFEVDFDVEGEEEDEEDDDCTSRLEEEADAFETVAEDEKHLDLARVELDCADVDEDASERLRKRPATLLRQVVGAAILKRATMIGKNEGGRGWLEEVSDVRLARACNVEVRKPICDSSSRLGKNADR